MLGCFLTNYSAITRQISETKKIQKILNKAVRIVDIHKIKTQVDGKDFPLRKSKTNDKC